MFEGEAEGFINKHPDAPAARAALAAITAFLHAKLG